MLCGGPALTQTGGHGDQRAAGEQAPRGGLRFPSHGLVCDGEAEVRKGARELLRMGADHIKMMLSGGVASPTDRVDQVQFSVAEIRAAVDEAQRAGKYVLAHAYTAESIVQGLNAGVRSFEHGNLMKAETAAAIKAADAYYVPTLVTYEVLVKEAAKWGMAAGSVAKADGLLEAGLEALSLADEAKVAIAFGTDLLAGMQRHQAAEFRLRAQVQPPLSILQSATVIGARLVGLSDSIGQIAPGFCADIVGVSGNPAESSTVLADADQTVRLVVSRGQIAVREAG